MGKNALLLPPPRGRTGEGPSGAGGGRFGRPGPRRRPGVEGKERGSCGEMIPCLTSAGDGVWWSGHGGQRRRCYKAGGGGARGAKEKLGRRRWLWAVDVILGNAPRPLL